MNLYRLPAAFYGISSSQCNHSWRSSNIGFRNVMDGTPATKQLSPSFQTLSSNNQNRHYHKRCHLHSMVQNSFFPDLEVMQLKQQWRSAQTTNVRTINRNRLKDVSTSLFSSSAPVNEGTTAENVGTQSERNDAEYENHAPTFRVFYNDVYEVNLPPRHRFPMGKYRKVRERVQKLITSLPKEEQALVNCDFHVSPLATFDELSTTHDPKYIQRFLHGDQTEGEQRNVGFPWSQEGVQRALSSVGGTMAAACFVCEEERRRRKGKITSSSLPPWGAHVAGGTHHAFHDYGEGFSVFSDMAVAANVVLERYPDVIKNKILMIDLDVHQGNGNAVLFQEENESKNHKKFANRVFTFSMHCSGNYFSKRQESDLDVELPIGCQDQAYLMTLNHWLKRFRKEHYREDTNKYKWDLVIFQAGVDVLEADRLGRMNLSSDAVGRRNKLVYEFARDLNVPLVICMGGGYPKRDDAWEPIIQAHADVYLGAHEFLARLSQKSNN